MLQRAAGSGRHPNGFCTRSDGWFVASAKPGGAGSRVESSRLRFAGQGSSSFRPGSAASRSHQVFAISHLEASSSVRK